MAVAELAQSVETGFKPHQEIAFGARRYFEVLKQKAPQCDEEFFIEAMGLTPDECGLDVLDTFRRVPQSAEKTVRYSSVSFLAPHERLIYASKVEQRKLDQLIDRFEDAGTNVACTDFIDDTKHRIIPFIDKSHLKAAFGRGNHAESFFMIPSGNIAAGGLDWIQLAVMLKGDDADAAIEAYKEICLDPNQTQDAALEVADGIFMYYDGGNKGESGALSREVQLIDNARHSVKVWDQWYPDGPQKRALNRSARKGVPTEALVSQIMPSLWLPSFSNIYYPMDMLNRVIGKVNGEYFEVRYAVKNRVHAKGIIVDAGTKSAVAFVGSHNGSDKGVKAGTREVMYEIRRPEIVHAIGLHYAETRLQTRP